MAQTIYQFPDGTWVENIAVRSNGNLLVTLLTSPELYEIDPSRPESSSAHLVHRFDGNVGLFGITEVEADVFAVVGGNFSSTSPSANTSSFAIWTADFSNCAGEEDAPRISQAVAVPGAALLNGMTTLEDGIVLVADSTLGNVRRVDTRSGAVTIVLADEETMGWGNASAPVGIDGVRREDGYLYYTNLIKGLFCRVRINEASGEAAGPFEVVADGLAEADDFAVRDGIAYVMEGAVEGVVRVGRDGEKEVLVDGFGDPAGVGSTSAQFGRGEDKGILYVVTGGGKVAAVDIGR
ncbi:Six-bladed beta-propeller TolB-like protein [Neofusicoccum parvum]|nr:Six-bladed beta-propeller TolB-like protein [Neofusicoccum parvum]